MKGFVSVTDNDWFAFLSQQPGIDEMNFWHRVHDKIRLKGTLSWQFQPIK